MAEDEVAEFAALLTELKARTGRSYDSLARRVRMNTSTLHRYCAGDAVPQDFAPVERLAAFCGATEPERLELHRRWLGALAARQRPRTPTAPEASREPVADRGPETPVRTAGVREPAPRPRPRRRRLMAVRAATVLTVILGVASFTLYADRRPAGPPQAAAVTPSGPRPPQAVPLTWTADSQVWEGGCDHDYVIAEAPRQVPPPPAPQDAAAWAATQGAVHGHETEVRISVQGRTDTAVILQDLRVRVVGRTHPAPGTAYSMAQGCGSDMAPRYFAVDLDKDRPVPHAVAAVDQGVRGPAANMPYRVSARDPEELLVKATTNGCDCRWYLELDWYSQGRTGTVRIDDHGRPFRTTAINGLPHYWYGSVGSRRQWTPVTG
ncbi:helix-turn-helix transcriptional regulator [Streptomyces sp. NPDC051976]|uniref:helix-turn-helix domain-containing protein n=1 Tax=Streptomyces sp. NPDC051976 TaxID=3154947 RepID=UPI0034311E82